jgi:hypothetical protein
MEKKEEVGEKELGGLAGFKSLGMGKKHMKVEDVSMDSSQMRTQDLHPGQINSYSQLTRICMGK